MDPEAEAPERPGDGTAGGVHPAAGAPLGMQHLVVAETWGSAPDRALAKSVVKAPALAACRPEFCVHLTPSV